jgi:hypothetical protein
MYMYLVSLLPRVSAMEKEFVYNLVWGSIIILFLGVITFAAVICIYWRYNFSYDQLNGNNGSYTNTDDHKVNPCKNSVKCESSSAHYHPSQKKRDAHPAEIRKEKKITLCKKISDLERCKLPMEQCNEVHKKIGTINVHWHADNKLNHSDATLATANLPHTISI